MFYKIAANFSQQTHHQQQPEEHFEYGEGVTLQTALTAFGSVASAAGGLAGSLSGGVRGVGQNV